MSAVRTLAQRRSAAGLLKLRWRLAAGGMFAWIAAPSRVGRAAF
jgi:hypothetical protein